MLGGMSIDGATPTPVPVGCSTNDMLSMSSDASSVYPTTRQSGRERRLSESGRSLVSTLGHGIPPIGQISSLLINAMHGTHTNGTGGLGMGVRNSHANDPHSINSFLTAMGQGGMGMMDTTSTISQLAGPDLGDAMSATPQTKPKRTKPKIRWSSKEHRATMQQAVEAVLVNGNTTKVAEQFGIPARTLRRYVAKEKQRRDKTATLVPNDAASTMIPTRAPPRTVSKPMPVLLTGSRISRPQDRTRTDSIDFVMNHIGNNKEGLGQPSMSECFGKEMIMSFGSAASTGRLPTMSADATATAKRERARTCSVDRILFEQMKSITPVNHVTESMNMDMDGFEIPMLCDDPPENCVDVSVHIHTKMAAPPVRIHSRALALKMDSKKRDRNASLDILSLKFEPAHQRPALVSKNLGVDSLLIGNASPGVGSLLSKSLSEWMASDLGRGRSSTVDSSMFATDLDVAAVTTPNLNCPDFGFSFEK